LLKTGFGCRTAEGQLEQLKQQYGLQYELGEGKESVVFSKLTAET